MRSIILYLLLFYWSQAYAQLDTAIVLPQVSIQSTAFKSQTIGSVSFEFKGSDLQNQQNRSLAELLNNQGHVYIKSYGPGSLATMSIRGSSANQSLVTWEGIPIQSPLLGLLDINLIPINGFNDISLTKGGASSLWGSGAVGGNINLSNQTHFEQDTAIQASIGIGSFGYQNYQLQTQFSSQHFSTKTSFNFAQTDNDFSFIPAPGLAIQNQTNAAFENLNLLQQFAFKFNPKNQLAIDLWYQNVMTQIPPLLTQTRSEAMQVDQALRTQLNWKRLFAKAILNTKIGFFDEEQVFLDPAIGLESQNNFKSFFTELNFAYSFSANNKLLLGLSNLNTRSEPNNFRAQLSENRLAFFVDYQWHYRSHALQLSLRESIIDGAFQLPTPIIAYEWQAVNHLKLRSKITRDFRFPSLNDRFWMPGGDANLNPENGWSQELGFDWHIEHKRFFTKLSLTGFNRLINDWILWAPSDAGSFFAAFNIASVWSRGIETTWQNQFRFDKTTINLKLDYAYIKSTNQIALEIPRIELGEQLLYTPRHNTGLYVDAGFKKLKLSYRHNWTGRVNGINEDVDAFSVGDMFVEKQFSIDQTEASIRLGAKNIFDKSYIVIERRPSPGRNFELYLNFKI